MPEQSNTEPFPAEPGTRVPWLCLHANQHPKPDGKCPHDEHILGYVQCGTLAVYSHGEAVVLLSPHDRGKVRCRVCGEWRVWRGCVRHKIKRPSLRRGV